MKKLIGLESLKTQEEFDSLEGSTVACTTGLLKGIEGKIIKAIWKTRPTPTKSNPYKKERIGVRRIKIHAREEHPNGSYTKYELFHSEDDRYMDTKGYWKLVK
ncbi:MAG: hypothetical protein CL524_08355 [Aequorivita sp.]|nr:hypothetical protein [Aequorivita sp.]|tara:strand:+ start:1525 stop:1833 length:309 start_codon:yes stop_codon:yes gene_type:complete